MMKGINASAGVLFYAITAQLVFARFQFGNLYDFELTSLTPYPEQGDDVKLSCRRTERYFKKQNQNFLTQGDSISWERNEQSLIATSRNNHRGNCTVKRDGNFLGRPSFGDRGSSRGQPKASCEDDGTTVTLTLIDWTPSRLSGDRWRCLQFPFAESTYLTVQSYVPVTSVSIRQNIDKGDYFKPSRGTLVTCVTSPSRPEANVDWFFKTEDGDTQITSQAELQENVDTDRNGLSTTTSTLLFTSDDDHGTTVYCKTANRGDQTQISSDTLTVIIKYPPTIFLRVEPSASVVEETDVTMYCSAVGRPIPEVRWLRKERDSDKPEIISVSPTLPLQSVSRNDGGEYGCQASNGLEPDALEIVVLFVREKPPPPATQPPSVLESPSSNILSSSNNVADDNDDDSVDGGAIAGGIIAVLIFLAIIGVIAFFLIRHRRGKQDIIENSSRQRSLSTYEGVYATCSTLPRNQSTLPPYIEVLPPQGSDKTAGNVTNPGYGMDSMIIAGTSVNRNKNANRPLPNTPYDCDSGYEEILDNNVSITTQHYQNSDVINDLYNDGYEVPVSPASRPVGNDQERSSSQSQKAKQSMSSPNSTGPYMSGYYTTVNKNRGSRFKPPVQRLYSNESSVDTHM